jgi:DNA repair ATPase RecN
MNKEQPSQEKEFRTILDRLHQFGDERNKLISEIDNIIDRISENRKPQVEPKSELTEISKSPEVVIPILRQKLREIDLDNERLKAISNRLNELV